MKHYASNPALSKIKSETDSVTDSAIATSTTRDFILQLGKVSLDLEMQSLWHGITARSALLLALQASMIDAFSIELCNWCRYQITHADERQKFAL